MMKSKARSNLLPYLLPLITIVFLICFFMIYPKDILGLVILQQPEDIYLIEGQLKVNKEYMNEDSIVNIIIMEKNRKKIIDSINLTQDFFNKIKAKDNWYYINLNDTGIKKELIEGNYTIIATIYYNNLVMDNIHKDIIFKKY